MAVLSRGTLVHCFERSEIYECSKFNRNIIKWITKEKGDGAKIQKFSSYIGKMGNLSGDSKVLTWTGWPELTTEEMNQLIEWIEDGGGLICGVCPWGVSQMKQIPVSRLPLTPILSKIGMVFAGKIYFAKDTGNKVHIVDNLAYLSNLSSLSEAIKAQPVVNEYLYT